MFILSAPNYPRKLFESCFKQAGELNAENYAANGTKNKLYSRSWLEHLK